MFHFMITLVLFNLALVSTPLLCASYITLKITNALWLAFLSLLYPRLEFLRTLTVRTLLDTHRNQAVIVVLLTVKGAARPDAVRRYLQEVVSRRNKSGKLAFPRLQHPLIIKCGQYAWKTTHMFDLDQNVTVADSTYKGRTVNEINIQEYVSEIVQKHLPTALPPWQLTIIPSSSNQHYILLKLHHALLSEGVTIGDMLPLEQPTYEFAETTTAPIISPLVQVLPRLEALPLLRQKITELIANNWNEFVAAYDPLECTELLETTPTIFQLFAALLIVAVSVWRETARGLSNVHPDFVSRLKFLIRTTRKEMTKRHFTVTLVICSILTTFNPIHIFVGLIRAIIYTFIFVWIRIPGRFWLETVALYNCFSIGYCKYTQQSWAVNFLYNYAPLIWAAFREMFLYVHIVFEAPHTLLSDIFVAKESLQTITLCGRKSVAWSEPVSIARVRMLAEQLQVTPTDLMLTSTAACLAHYLRRHAPDHNARAQLPHSLPVTVRNINSSYIFGSGHGLYAGVGGLVCLQLPIPLLTRPTAGWVVQVHEALAHALQKEDLSHLLTLMHIKQGVLTRVMPACILAIYLKYLSRTYAIGISEISNDQPDLKQRTTWGQTVESAIYWRPPQANTSVSLCLNEYGGNIRLAAMCDAQLGPMHRHLVQPFGVFFRNLTPTRTAAITTA